MLLATSDANSTLLCFSLKTLGLCCTMDGQKWDGTFRYKDYTAWKNAKHCPNIQSILSNHRHCSIIIFQSPTFLSSTEFSFQLIKKTWAGKVILGKNLKCPYNCTTM